MSPPLLPQDITMTETEETVLDLVAKLRNHAAWLDKTHPKLNSPVAFTCRQAAERLVMEAGRDAELTELRADRKLLIDAGYQNAEVALAALSRAPEAQKGLIDSAYEAGVREGWKRSFNAERKAAALSPPSTGGEGEAVAWAMLQRDGSVLSVQAKPYHEGFAQMMATDCGCTVQALGPVHPSPEMGEISRAAVLRMIGDAFQDGGGCVEGHDWSWDVVEFKAVANKLADKLKENGLSREELGGLARSLPSADAQERSPVPPLSDGWRDIESTTPPHDTAVLLGWQDGRGGCWISEVAAYSTGERFDNGYSNLSLHGSATHWMPLPSPPQNSDGEDA